MPSKYTAKVNKGREKIRKSMSLHFQKHPRDTDPLRITARREVTPEELDDERQYYSERKRNGVDFSTRLGK